MKEKDDIAEKMKLTDRQKKKPRFLKKKSAAHRPSIQSNYSVVSLSDVTEESIEVWRGLPEEIRADPALASFRKKHEKILGSSQFVDPKQRHDSSDYDPLPADDNYFSDEERPGLKKINELTIIKISNSDEGDDDAIEGPKDTNIRNVMTEEEAKKADDDMHRQITGHREQNKYVKYTKMTILLICWVVFTLFLMLKDEKVLHFRQLAISEEETRTYGLSELPVSSRIKLIFKGAFLTDHYDTSAKNHMSFYLTLHDQNGNEKNISKLYQFATVDLEDLDKADQIKRSKIIHLEESDYESLYNSNSTMKVNMLTSLEESFSINLAYDPSPLNKTVGIALAAIILIGLYILIIWELVHRTFAAMIASTLSIGILAAMNERPTMSVIMSWIDTETLLLLFGMMIIVAVLAETGAFDYLAVYAFKITNGKVWPLIICLCLFTAVVSSFLDNVTTILLMTPVTIRLCEVMELNPVPVLMITVIYSNIGGTATPVGDPPNLIISNSYIAKSGINFTNFTLHMTFGVILVMIQTYFQLRFMFKKVSDLRFSEPKDVIELRHEITVWQRAAATLSPFSKDEDLVRKTLVKKVERLQRELKKKLTSGAVPTESYQATLEELQQKYPIKNKNLLIKSGIALTFIITFFFLHSAPDIQKLSLGWTALIGAVLLLILYDREDVEAILAHVEWATLLFFAALFVLMEALSELGLIDFIGKQAITLIQMTGENARLAVAILIILWISAIASAFVDNIPFTTMMIKIVISLSQNESLNLPLQPLVWALALGACLGGNGTLIGASANVVCAGVAEQHGYKFTFVEFFKIGFPVMIGGIITATFYLMVCHILFTWH